MAKGVCRPIDDDIVISGIGGRFPESDNIDELASNLLNGVDMVTRDGRRWPIGLNDNSTSRSGKIKNLEYFDNSYFCTLPILADNMEPGSRIILETTYEAIADAGIAPPQIRGSKTGVYVGINSVANAEAIPQDDFSDIRAKDAAFWVYGTSKALIANRISFLFDLTGPSTVIDTACSASMVALANAVLDLRTGQCDMAVVATSNICMAPYSSYIFHALGLLSPDGKCKVFDKNADGFVRSETVGALFLMRKSMAKRIYATILHAKTNTDGFKTIGLFAPFWLRQRNLMVETYEEAGLKPEDIDYFESHGTGTNVGDPQESKAVSEAYCKNRKDKLLVGAVKSNLGHSEGASGLCSIAKGIVIFEHKTIPANLHYKEPKPEIDSLHKTIEPVVSNLPFVGKVIGVNSFGVGGVNAHVLLKINEKEAGKDLFVIAEPIPRLVNICGRTEEAIEYIFDFIEQNPLKVHRDFLALLNDSMKTVAIKGSANFPYRGYMIIDKEEDKYRYRRTIADTKQIQPLWLVFSGMGSQWAGMGNQMMRIEVFRKSIEKSARVLKQFDVDLLQLILEEDESLWTKHTVNSFVAITAMQIALFDLFKLLDLPVDGIIGHSFGEIACAYADGCISAEGAILTSYWRGKTVFDTKETLPKGLMAAVGLTVAETEDLCPNGVYVACHNGHDSVTISGQYEAMEKFIETLQEENIFVRKVAGGEFPYHSVEMEKVAPKLLEKLNQVILEPKQQTLKWISTSIAQIDQDCPPIVSGEYFVRNLINPVYFEEGMQRIPEKSLCIEMAPHSLFSSIFKRCYKNLNYISLMKKNEPNNVQCLLEAIGEIYTYGFNPAIENLYPKVEWPAARGTQSISSLIKWDYSRQHEVKLFPDYHNFSTASNYIFKLTLFDSDWRFLKGHCIDKRVVFPATGYIMIVWRALATKVSQPWYKFAVEFENIRIYRPTLLSENTVVKFTIQIIDKLDQFVVVENNSLVCKGTVRVGEGAQFLTFQDRVNDDEELDDTSQVDNKEIYKELRIRGYDYGPIFQGLHSASGDGSSGLVQWTGNWISFIDSALHLSLFSLPIRALFVPVGIDSFKCDPTVLLDAIHKKSDTESNENDDDEDSGKNLTKQHLKSEFCYFREMAKNNALIAQNDVESIAQNDDTIPLEIINFTFENETNNEAKKKTLFSVKFDWNNQLLVTKGIEVRGLIPINIPRKCDNQNLILERYSMVPFVENGFEKLEEELETYVDACGKIFRSISKKLELKDCDEQSRKLLEKFTAQQDSPYRYMQCFKQFLAEGCDGDLVHHLQRSMAEFEADQLNAGLFDQEQFARPILELIAQNCQHLSVMKLLEICPTQTFLAEKLSNLLKLNVIHKFELDYIVTKHSESKLSEPSHLKTIDWSMSDVDFFDSFSDLDLIVVRCNAKVDQLWNSEENVKKMLGSLKENGFILLVSRDQLLEFEQDLDQLLTSKLSLNLLGSSKNLTNLLLSSNCQLISDRRHCRLGVQFTLLRKCIPKSDSFAIKSVYIDESDAGRSWIESLKSITETCDDIDDGSRIWLVSSSPTSGIIGLANCLRLEQPYGRKIRLILILDQDSDVVKAFRTLDPKSPLVEEILSKDLYLNVFKNGQWGSYCFVRIAAEPETKQTSNAYLSQTQIGDLSSLRWFQSEHEFYQNLPVDSDEVLCDVYCSALNFKDIVLATGKIIPGPESSLFDCILGLEFSGRRRDTGVRVMGMVPFKGIATSILTFKEFVWSIPDSWTMEDAATVPVVYITAYYALVMRGQLRKGESVLIHCAAGGVGQAAIHICQSFDCDLYVTVGTEEKREYIQKNFGLSPEHILHSRDVSFEPRIKTLTNGRGVDVVLNSLTGDKLQASLRCLAINGRFLEIGKYDMQMSNTLGMFAFLNNITFHGVGLDCFFREGLQSKKLKQFIDEVTVLIDDGIKNGVVKPIDRTVFQLDQADKAFRYMTNGKHIGKVLIRIREEESPFRKFVLDSKPVFVEAISRTWFSPNKVYIIAGGLGGVGLELAYWMVIRGARKLILTSRTGIKSNFQRVFLDRFRLIEQFSADYKISFHVSTKNIAKFDECESLIEEAQRDLGPIGGIFNLTLVLEDALFPSQTRESFDLVCGPKMDGLANLDQICREKNLCPDHFVAFSSFSAGRGNAGQTNYGYANSAMERIIEKRIASGLSGIAIQFGPINDVGVVAEYMQESGDESGEESMRLLMGLSMQRINSCLEVIDRLLPLGSGIFSSYVKYSSNANKDSNDDEVIKQLCIHLNIDKRPDDECLGDIGLDSMAAVEIQQRLERDFNISLSLADVRKITVKELKNFRDGNRHNLMQYSNDIKVAKANLSRIRFVIPTAELSALNSAKEGKPIYCLPPLKGLFDVISFLAQKINRPVIGLNWTRQLNEFRTLDEIVNYYFELLIKLEPSNENGTYDLIVTSFGALILVIIGKSKQMSKRIKFSRIALVDLMPQNFEEMNDERRLSDYKVLMIFDYIRLYIPERICEQSMKEVLDLNCEHDRLEKIIELLRKCVGNSLQGPDMSEIITNTYQRASLMIEFHFEIRQKSKSTIRHLILQTLFRNRQLSLHYFKMFTKQEQVKKFECKMNSIVEKHELNEEDRAHIEKQLKLHLLKSRHDNVFNVVNDTVQELLHEIMI